MSNTGRSPLQRYIGHLEKGELVYQFSPSAGQPVFYPRVACPYTGSEELEWRISSGRGVVYSTTMVHPATGETYNVALIDLREGFRMMSRVEGVAPADIRIGMAVQFRVVAQGDDEPPIPVFVPAVDRP